MFRAVSERTKMIIVADGDIIRNDYKMWPGRVQILPLRTDKYIEFINSNYKREVLPAFFDNKEGIINHVGIIMHDNYIIHSHGKVRIDRLDHTGIFNTDTKSYSHKLRVIKKII